MARTLGRIRSSEEAEFSLPWQKKTGFIITFSSLSDGQKELSAALVIGVEYLRGKGPLNFKASALLEGL